MEWMFMRRKKLVFEDHSGRHPQDGHDFAPINDLAPM